MKHLVATFDVTDLTDRAIEALWGEVLAQAESNEDHPDVTANITLKEVTDG